MSDSNPSALGHGARHDRKRVALTIEGITYERRFFKHAQQQAQIGRVAAELKLTQSPRLTQLPRLDADDDGGSVWFGFRVNDAEHFVEVLYDANGRTSGLIAYDVESEQTFFRAIQERDRIGGSPNDWEFRQIIITRVAMDGDGPDAFYASFFFTHYKNMILKTALPKGLLYLAKLGLTYMFGHTPDGNAPGVSQSVSDGVDVLLFEAKYMHLWLKTRT